MKTIPTIKNLLKAMKHAQEQSKKGVHLKANKGTVKMEVEEDDTEKKI